MYCFVYWLNYVFPERAREREREIDRQIDSRHEKRRVFGLADRARWAAAGVVPHRPAIEAHLITYIINCHY